MSRIKSYRALLENIVNESRGQYVIETSTGMYIAKAGALYVDVSRSSADSYDSIDEAESLFDEIAASFKGMTPNDLTVVNT